MIPWFSKTEGNTYSTLPHHPLLFWEIQRSAQEVARRISSAVAGESVQKSTYQVPITIPISCITLFAICLSFSSPPLHPCRFIRPLSLSILPLFLYLSPFARFLFSRMVGIVVYLLLNREPKIYGSSSAYQSFLEIQL